MSTDTLEAPVATTTLYLVRVTTKSGSYSVGWDDPKRVLKAIAEFEANGVGEVGVYDLLGKPIDRATIEATAARWRD